MKRKNKGFVVIAVLVVVGFSYFLYDRIVSATFYHSLFTKNLLAGEQAKQLIFLGMNLGLNRLVQFESGVVKKVEKPSQGITIEQEEVVKTVNHSDRLRTFYTQVLPILNSWQTFILTQEHDGVDAEIFLCLTSEEGKFNLNETFDFEQKVFKPEFKKVFEKFKLKNIKTGEGDLEKIIASFVEKNNKKFNDVTQIPLDERVEMFYQPNFFPQEMKNQEKDKRGQHEFEHEKKEKEALPSSESKKYLKKFEQDVYLADMFTLDVGEKSINPLLLSSSMLAVFGVSEAKIKRYNDRFENNINSWTKSLSYETGNFNQADSLISSIFISEEREKILAEEEKLEKDGERVAGPSQGPMNHPEKYKFFLALKEHFAKNIDPHTFSLLCAVRYQDVVRRAVMVFRRQPIKDRYEKKSQLEVESDSNKDKLENDVSGENEEKPGDKKNAKISGRVFFLPVGFEIIRFYWL